MRKKIEQKIISDLKTNYDMIADRYAKTRDRSWPAGDFIETYLNSALTPGIALLDVGSGSGILVERLSEFDMPFSYSGFDISKSFVRQAKKRYGSQYSQIMCNWQAGDMHALPYKDASFEHCFALASLHHVPSFSRRQAVLAELFRVLKPGGSLIMTNWFLWHAVAFKKYELWRQLSRVFSGYDFGDFMIPWKNEQQQTIATRYVHAFFTVELDYMLREAGFVLVKPSYLQKRHDQSLAQSICSIVKKPD